MSRSFLRLPRRALRTNAPRSACAALVLVAGCLDDLAAPEGVPFCAFTRTQPMAEVFARLGADAPDAVATHSCAEPLRFVVLSPFADVPRADIEPAVDVIRIEALRAVDAALDADAYPCGEGGEATAEIAVCGALDAPLAQTHITSYETDEPLPLADPVNFYELGFAFASDRSTDNDFAAPPHRPNDFYAGTDRWYQGYYEPARGWSLWAFEVRGGGPVGVETGARLIVDGPVVTLIVPRRELLRSTPELRINLMRHTGDRGRAPPHDWSGFVFPAPSDPLL